MLVDGGLPVQEFIDAERIALTRLFEAEQATADGGDNFCLAADNPPSRIGRRKVRNCQRAAVGANNVLHARTHLYGHFTLYSNLTI